MRSIDERIVDMQFNNHQFEQGIAESLNSLDNLNKSLGKMGDNGAFSDLASNVDTIADRFTALGTIAAAAIENITNKIIDMGVELLKSVTIDPVAEGFSKYEQIVGAQQTIINATGLSIGKSTNSYKRLISLPTKHHFGLTTWSSTSVSSPGLALI